MDTVSLGDYAQSNRPQSEEVGTYLVLYGRGCLYPGMTSHNQVGNFRENAKALFKKLIEKYGKDSEGKELNNVHIFESYSESLFYTYVNMKYPTGKIRGLYTHSHGSINSINLGGDLEEAKKIGWIDGNTVVPEISDYKNVSLISIESLTNNQSFIKIDAATQQKILNEVQTNQKEHFEILNIDKDNFEDGAEIILRGCNMGNDKKGHYCVAQALADHIGNNVTVKAFDEFSNFFTVGGKPTGKVIYNGKMIRDTEKYRKMKEEEVLISFAPSGEDYVSKALDLMKRGQA